MMNRATETLPAASKTADIARISEIMGRMRLMIGRRVISRTVIDDIAPSLEISHLDVLDAMRRIDGEVTVGAIADAMRLDPSRGSRLVTELVTQGILKRDASQMDGRRSILVRTEMGDRLLKEIHATKRRLLASMLDGWTEDELSAFAVLFDKFVSRFENTYSNDKGGPPLPTPFLAKTPS
ncbi:winged helix-turn-helix transcriptional regulator [Aliirhizobium smilacinae]|uniref:Winged helix-turn-helix transcriptional regulator n=2 Tax=Aliirhizobium smilacinae TaxID=1395944 RepID=A0A5C4XRZ2_9HYPH|nr:winged helix-turn-helix transcriptional regulator [Rhizobium smilacinae]